MAITIEERESLDEERRDCTVLTISGRITLSECHGELRNAVRGLIDRGRKQIVLDLEAVPFVDSAGLGELVGSYASVVRLEGTLRLTGVNPRVRDALDSVGLGSILRIVTLPRRASAPTATARKKP
ncbi:MAG: STAS domain-containing protein [Acidobacteria bacterium]|nr:STAS domain-containing protein [Acidobacteriota bacterium]